MKTPRRSAVAAVETEREAKNLCRVDYGFLRPETRKFARRLWRRLAGGRPTEAEPDMFEEIAVLDMACHALGDIAYRRLMRRTLSPSTYAKLCDVCFDVAYSLRMGPAYLKYVARDGYAVPK